MNVKLISCICTDKDISNPNLLYHFIKHYSNLGITHWSLTLHTSNSPEFNNLNIYKDILDNFRIPYKVWQGEYDDVRRVTVDNILIARQNLETWLLVVDLDEFVNFPCAIPEYLANLDQQGYNCLTGEMVDYITVNGELPKVTLELSLNQQFPRKFDLRKNTDIDLQFSKYNDLFRQKKIAIKKPLQWWIGHHDINEKTKSLARNYPYKLEIKHYPWDNLKVIRIKKLLYEQMSRTKPPAYSEQEYLITQTYRLKVVDYLQKHGKFNLI
jgi:hypothetical protein